MKIVQIEPIIDAGEFSHSDEWKRLRGQITQAIKSVQWPPGSGSFTLYDEPGKKRGKGSGVKPIKQACMNKLESLGWQLETPIDIATVVRPGPMDATIQVRDHLFCVEWETGNVSSSHRAINKMALGILKKILMPIKRRLYDFPRRDYLKEWEMINIDEHDRLITCVKKGNRMGAASIIKDEHWNFDYHQKYLKKFYTPNRET